MKRWIARILVALLLVVVLLAGGACAVISYMSVPHDIPGVPRDTLRIDQMHVVSYLHAGDATAQRIIYIHGSPGMATDWSRYLREPLSGFESIALDRFGFGATQPNAPVA